MAAALFVRERPIAPQPAPFAAAGLSGWIARRFFASPTQIAMTILGTAAFVFILDPALRFFVIDAVWTGTSRDACASVTTGACWPFVQAKFNQFIYGFYPAAERWRPNIVFALGALLLIPLLTPAVPLKRLNAFLFLAVYPIIAFVLLTGGNLDFQSFVAGRLLPVSRYFDLAAQYFGLGTAYFTLGEWHGMRARFWLDYAVSALLLTAAIAILARLMGTRFSTSLKLVPPVFILLALVIAPVDADFGLRWVETREWGGLLVTLVVAITGIVAALPLGVLLALGRRSEMRLLRWTSIIFIEFWRGVPLITILFFATYMLPLFLPGGASIERLVRALIGVALFSGAYMAEVVRGGLQAVPRHQYESAASLGFGYWKTMGLVVLPQALTSVIPGIVNNFIGLFKDTTLVQIVAILDLLGQVRTAFSDPNWSSPTTLYTGFAFAGIIYFFFCFAMSRYSLFLERRAGVSTLRMEMERR